MPFIKPQIPNGGSLTPDRPIAPAHHIVRRIERLAVELLRDDRDAPSYSVRVTRRASCSQVINLPCLSLAHFPLLLLEGLRNTPTSPVSSSHFMIRLFGTSLHSMKPPIPKPTPAPPPHRIPEAIFSTFASASLYFPKLGSTTSTSGSGYRGLGSHSARTWRAIIADPANRTRCKQEVSALDHHDAPVKVASCADSCASKSSN
jgi:hypothetical protein